ncbi:MAG TPA: ATPase domain-containing protein [Candidatus Dormibacteraeota bacterium]|nr:ATPase domain-containing protein [Candidatus Dormibacteraeota bacterium]
MIDRLPSGNQRLDDILNGGLLKNAINLIVGVPGSGKTILSQQFAFHNATVEQPALYLSTLSEPLDKILRFGETLNVFDHRAIQEGRVIYEDIGHVLGDNGLDSILGAIEALLKDLRPGIVVIDSFRAFAAVSHDTTEFRRFLYSLTRLLGASATTAVWNAPYTREQAMDAAEFAVADSIIALDIKQAGARELRVLQVLKLRGSAYRSGEHAYRITEAGFDVFPRLADVQDGSLYKLSEERSSTGIEALDKVLGEGGYWSGAATMVAGPSGIGKTLMGLHFLFRGAESGEPGILATFQENETQLTRVAKSFGWSFTDTGVRVLSRSVVDIYIDEWVYLLLDLIEQTGARRIVIDSLPDVMIAAADPIRFREWMFSLTQRLERAGISMMMIVEVPELFQLRRISEQGLSHLADNVVLLQYVQEGPELVRALTVLKTRAMHHHPVVHRYEITEKGFVLGDVLTLTR